MAYITTQEVKAIKENINKLLKIISNFLCKHKNTTETFRYYPDRYIKCICNSCNKEIYKDI